MSDLLQIGVLSAVAIACALLSPFLVLKRMTMFANSLSHTILLGIALAFLLSGSAELNLWTLLIGAFSSAILTALCTGGLMRVFRLQEDASMGLVFTALFALSILIVTLYLNNVHLGVEAVMGNVDLLSFSDLKLTLLLALLNLFVVCLCFKPLQLISFDANLARTMGVKTSLFHFTLLLLTAATCIGAFRAVGVLLVLAFLVGPFLTARLFCHRLKTLLFFTPLLGIFASISGVGLSRLSLQSLNLPLSTGGLVVVLIGVIYLFSKWIHSIRMQLCEKKSPS